jgi:hypothetical protein
MDSANASSQKLFDQGDQNGLDYVKNQWGINRISVHLLSSEKNSLTTITVAAEVGKQDASQKVNSKEIQDYLARLVLMKEDLKDYAGMSYKSRCVQRAASLGMRNIRDGSIVSTWESLGNDFQCCPSWEKAIMLYHSLYTCVDECPDYKSSLEREWLTNHHIVYSGDYPKGRYVTGIHTLISQKICSLRKDIACRVSRLHGFKVIKSIPKDENGKQAPRRVMYHFNKGYVTQNQGKTKINDVDFETYLKSVHGKLYVAFEDIVHSVVANNNHIFLGNRLPTMNNNSTGALDDVCDSNITQTITNEKTQFIDTSRGVTLLSSNNSNLFCKQRSTAPTRKPATSSTRDMKVMKEMQQNIDNQRKVLRDLVAENDRKIALSVAKKSTKSNATEKSKQPKEATKVCNKDKLKCT